MIAIARADDVRLISDGEDGWISVPDLKIPAQVAWGGYGIPGQGAFVLWFEHNGRKATTLWQGPYTIGAGTYYLIDAPKAVLQKLRDQLGSTNVYPLVRALRLQNAKGDALRAWAKAEGFKVVRNSSNQIVNVLPKLVICGHNPLDMDGEDVESAEVIPDMEP